MPNRRLLAAVAAAAVALAAVLPGIVSAADGPDVTGTVTRGGAPVAGAVVRVLVDGSDMVFTATTDANGAWGVTAGVAAGQSLTVSATGATVSSSPDARGCSTQQTPTGRVTVKVDALPLAPIAVALDSVLSSTVCTATATPRQVATLPATDTTGTPSSRDGGTGWLLAVTLLGAVTWLATAPLARRPADRR